MAEAAFRQILAQHGHENDVQVVSAGLHATPGREAHPWAQAAFLRAGLSLSQHRAKSLTAKMVDSADAVFAMDFQNRAELLTRYPNARHKIFMMSAYADPPQRAREISDPYHGNQESTHACFALLRSCVARLEASLFPSTQPAVADESLVNSNKDEVSLGEGMGNA
jgi:protein-tyrosine-phosphatase